MAHPILLVLSYTFFLCYKPKYVTELYTFNQCIDVLFSMQRNGYHAVSLSAFQKNQNIQVSPSNMSRRERWQYSEKKRMHTIKKLIALSVIDLDCRTRVKLNHTLVKICTEKRFFLALVSTSRRYTFITHLQSGIAKVYIYRVGQKFLPIHFSSFNKTSKCKKRLISLILN